MTADITGVDDPARLHALASYHILDTPPEEGYDDIVHLACDVCACPVALVSLVAGDRQWFKARVGFEPCQTPIEQSVCAHALLEPDLLIIPDLTHDPRTRANPLVTDGPNLRFYAGAPLVAKDGERLGTLCVIDHKPRLEGLSPRQAFALRALARQIMTLLDLRRAVAARDQILERQRVGIEQQEALIETQWAVSNAAGELDVILDALVAGALRAVPQADGGAIQMRDADTFVYRTARGDLAPYVGLRRPLRGSLTGHCILTGDPILCADVDTDDRCDLKASRQIGMRSSIHVPVIRGGNVIAAMKLQSREPSAFSDRDLLIAQLFAGTVAGGLAEAAEIAAEAETRKLAAIIEQATDFVGMTDLDGVFTFINPAGRRLVGLPASGLLPAASITSLIADESGPLTPMLTAVVADGWWENELLIRRIRSGPPIPVRFSVFPVRDNLGGVVSYATVARDLSERKEASAALRASETNLRTVLETVPVGIVFAEAPSGRIVGGNARMVEISGHPLAFSDSVENYGEWVAYHADGRLVQPGEYPLARVIRDGVDEAEIEVHYQRPDGRRVWIDIVGAPIHDVDGVLTGAVVAVLDIDDRKTAEAAQSLMNHELSHRMKNLLAIVLAITRQSARGATDATALGEVLCNRLVALGRAHDILLGGTMDTTPIGSVIASGVGVHDDGTSTRFSTSGPEIWIGGKAALSLAVMMHELSTNATKYGAFSVPEGHVTVAWSLVEEGGRDTLRIEWREFGGPPVTPPMRKGFGSMLIERGLTGQVGGTVTLDHAPTGVVCTVVAPLLAFQQAI